MAVVDLERLRFQVQVDAEDFGFQLFLSELGIDVVAIGGGGVSEDFDVALELRVEVQNGLVYLAFTHHRLCFFVLKEHFAVSDQGNVLDDVIEEIVLLDQTLVVLVDFEGLFDDARGQLIHVFE